MTEILLNDDQPNLLSHDGIPNQTEITNVDVVQPTTTSSSLVRRDSIVIPSISNSSISSVIQIENNNNNNNNSLLPVCTSNSLGKRTILSIKLLFFLSVNRRS